MELTVADLAVCMDRMLFEELHLELERSLFWTYSMSVLMYIQNETRRFQTFVTNHLNVIRHLSEVSQWKYIGTKLNPVDYASRGLHINTFLKTNTWIGGPNILKKTPHCWPDLISELVLSPD